MIRQDVAAPGVQKRGLEGLEHLVDGGVVASGDALARTELDHIESDALCLHPPVHTCLVATIGLEEADVVPLAPDVAQVAYQAFRVVADPLRQLLIRSGKGEQASAHRRAPAQQWPLLQQHCVGAVLGRGERGAQTRYPAADYDDIHDTTPGTLVVFHSYLPEPVPI